LKGQAVLEYIFLLLIAMTFSSQFFKKNFSALKNTRGKLAHKMFTRLSSGVCSSNCFFQGYQNWYLGN